MANKLTMQEQVNEILAKAEQKGVQSNFFFVTTFKRYQVQMQILNNLEKAVTEYGATITKEYVKGRETITAHPLISKINSTIDSANKTASLLVKMISTKELVNEDEYDMNDLYFMDDKEVIRKLSPSTNINKMTKEEIMEYSKHLRDGYKNSHEFDL